MKETQLQLYKTTVTRTLVRTSVSNITEKSHYSWVE